MTQNDLTLRMLATVNDGVAGIPVPELRSFANGLLMVKDNLAAKRIGNMLLELVQLNEQYTGVIDSDPFSVGRLEIRR